MYNRKWYSKRIKWKKPSKIRKIWKTSSFQTSLRNIRNNYPKNILKKLGFNIPYKFNKDNYLLPSQLNLEQQLKLLILDIGTNTKKVKNWNWNLVWIKGFLWTALLWNKWAIKKIYEIFHHTKPDRKTKERIKKIIPKYYNKLIQVT